jgi:hypothetical protein
MRTKLLIVQLGGNKEVARACAVSSQAVTAWISSDSIPREHHVTLWAMALAAGVDWEPPGADAIRARLAPAGPPAKAEAA